jgi:D-alanyl-D-alanine carboxypeptidase
MPPPPRASLARVHRQLGIPADYAARRKLPRQREANRLVSIGPAADDGRRVLLSPAAAAAWRRLQRSAREAGIELLALSGFRGVNRQTQLIRAKLKSGQRLQEILRLVAAPGHSEHHTGRAVDIAVAGRLELNVAFARTPAFRWLKRHAPGFGFTLSYPRNNPHRIRYEPWHWFYAPARVRRSL